MYGLQFACRLERFWDEARNAFPPTRESFGIFIPCCKCAMRTLLKIALLPIAFPVAFGYNLSKLAWRQMCWKPPILGVFAFIIGPLISVLLGFELALYLGWTLEKSVYIWLSAFVVFEVAMVGVILPILLLACLPLLWALNGAFRALFAVIWIVQGAVGMLCTKIGRLLPVYDYWDPHEVQPVASELFRGLSIMYCLLSLSLRCFLLYYPVWAYIFAKLQLLLPWFSEITLSVFALIAALPLASPFATLAIHPAWVRIPNIYLFSGPLSLCLAHDLASYTNLLDIALLRLHALFRHAPGVLESTVHTEFPQPTTWTIISSKIALCAGFYLLTFVFIIPLFGALLRRGVLATLLFRFVKVVMTLRSWAEKEVYQDDNVMSLLCLMTGPIIVGINYMIGAYYEIHPMVVLVHASVISTITFPLCDMGMFSTTIHVLLSTVFAIHLEYILPQPWRLPIGVLLPVAMSPLLFRVFLPLLAVPLYPLVFVSFALPEAVFSTIHRMRDRVGRVVVNFGYEWKLLILGAFDDHSPFSTLFGWVLTLVLSTSLFLYCCFFFLSAYPTYSSQLETNQHLLASPTLEMAKRAILWFDPGVSTLITFQHNYTAPSFHHALSSAISTSQTSILALYDSFLSNTTNPIESGLLEILAPVASLGFNSSISWNAIMGSIGLHLKAPNTQAVVEGIALLIALANLTLLLGKTASTAPSGILVCTLIHFFYVFVHVRQASILQCSYRIITEIFAVEFALLVSLFTGPGFFALTRYLTRPYVLFLAQLISMPLEKLCAIQMRMFRNLARRYVTIKSYFLTVDWTSLVKSEPATRQVKTPPYRRPRRYT